jgi:hypothetical protein
MGASGGDGWFSGLPRGDAGIGPRVQALLERTEATHRRSAARLRSSGDKDGALKVERFAEWARFDLDEPLVAQQLYRASAVLRRIPQLDLLAKLALDNVLSLAGAERGNVQLADPASGALKIIAQRGFDAAFLNHFAVVADGSSACGRSASLGAQLIIADVSNDPGFEPHRDIAAASGFRAVQSTPLVDRAGRVLGVVSTHYPRPFTPPARNMRIVKRYADLVGQVLASRGSPAPLPGFTAAVIQPLAQ